MNDAFKSYHIKQKQIYFKAYKHLSQLENALKQIKEEDTSNLQISILVKVDAFYLDTDNELPKDIKTIKRYWKKLLNQSINFGNFHNSETGNILIIGALAPVFLHKVNGKPLANLSSGPYGIFRGMGINETQATTYLKLLNSGNYLLILRGFDNELYNLENVLD
jgi:hypothetical protein